MWKWLLVGGIFIVAAALLWWASLRPVAKARHVLATWTMIPVTITRSQVTQFDPRTVARGKSGFVFQLGPGGDGPGTPKTMADIHFEYSMDGVSAQSNRITLHPETRSEQVEALVAQYPEGASFDAWVNPRNHRDVVLAPQASLHPTPVNPVPLWIMVAAGVLTIVIGLGLFGPLRN